MSQQIASVFQSLDGFKLAFTLFLPSQCAIDNSILPQAFDKQFDACVVIGSATAVVRSYYSSFASFLASHGIPTLTFDYRGIGGSRPLSLKGFEANEQDWGKQDLPAAIWFMRRLFPHCPLVLVGHSIGMHSVAFASAATDDAYQQLSRIVSVSAQHAYWRLNSWSKQLWFLAMFGVLMPIATHVYGYLPARKLGMKLEV